MSALSQLHLPFAPLALLGSGEVQSIQQNQSNKAVVSALSQLHLPSVLLALLSVDGWRKPNIQRDQSSKAVVSALSQQHLPSVPLGLSSSLDLKGNSPTEHARACCMVTIAMVRLSNSRNLRP